MSAIVMQVNQAEVKFGDPETDGSVVAGNLTDFGCQVTRAEITSSSNTTTSSVPATFCQPASEVQVPVASTFNLDLDFLQDWSQAAGLSAWLFKNDAREKAFALYLKGTDNPVAYGKIIAQAGAFGGTPGEPLTASVSLGIQGYPVILDAAGTPLRDPLDLTTDPVFAPAAAMADLATLKADGTVGDGNFTGRAMTTGEYIVLGDASRAHYTAGAWAVGPMP